MQKKHTHLKWQKKISFRINAFKNFQEKTFQQKKKIPEKTFKKKNFWKKLPRKKTFLSTSLKNLSGKTFQINLQKTLSKIFLENFLESIFKKLEIIFFLNSFPEKPTLKLFKKVF